MSNDDRSEIRTYFKITDLTRWLGISTFEILINLISFLIFTIFLVFVVDGNDESFFMTSNIFCNDTRDSYHPYPPPTIDYTKLFAVLFCADILNSYFCFIVILRLYLANLRNQAIHRLFWSSSLILLTGLFKYLLCLKLAGGALEYTEVFSPIFVLLQLFALRACQIKN
ncbi:unnamed protein product [Diamesa serratosioi]